MSKTWNVFFIFKFFTEFKMISGMTTNLNLRIASPEMKPKFGAPFMTVIHIENGPNSLPK